MPTYDYRCNACGHEFEEFQSITAPVLRKCPSCGKLKLERLIGTGAGVIFKGGGFYETDYRSDSYKKSAEAEKKAADGKTDSKPDSSAGKDAKSDAKPKAEKSASDAPAKPAPSKKKPGGDKRSK